MATKKSFAAFFLFSLLCAALSPLHAQKPEFLRFHTCPGDQTQARSNPCWYELSADTLKKFYPGPLLGRPVPPELAGKIALPFNAVDMVVYKTNGINVVGFKEGKLFVAQFDFSLESQKWISEIAKVDSVKSQPTFFSLEDKLALSFFESNQKKAAFVTDSGIVEISQGEFLKSTIRFVANNDRELSGKPIAAIFFSKKNDAAIIYIPQFGLKGYKLDTKNVAIQKQTTLWAINLPLEEIELEDSGEQRIVVTGKLHPGTEWTSFKQVFEWK